MSDRRKTIPVRGALWLSVEGKDWELRRGVVKVPPQQRMLEVDQLVLRELVPEIGQGKALEIFDLAWRTRGWSGMKNLLPLGWKGQVNTVMVH